MTLQDRVRVLDVKLLSDNWYVLKTTHFEFRRRDGRWQEQRRETYDRGNGAVILLYNLAARRVVLTRQFRYPAFVNGLDELLVEAPAGLLDEQSPEECIRAEAEQEAGYRVRAVRQVMHAFMSPGSVTERLHFYVAPYTPADRVSDGGGLADDGEDIEVLELRLGDALAMVADGRIADGKTIILLQWLAGRFRRR